MLYTEVIKRAIFEVDKIQNIILIIKANLDRLTSVNLRIGSIITNFNPFRVFLVYFLCIKVTV